jgi:predicted extracellular nuclease
MGAAVLSVALACAGSVLASASGVVISEFRFRGPVGGNDEYVELMNAGSAAVDISSWKLQGCSSTTGVASDRTTVPAGVVLQAGEHYLFVNNNASGGYSGTVAGDRTYGTGFTDGAGARIIDSTSAVVDGVGGTGIGGTQCREGTGISNMPTANGDQSYERIGGAQDTDDNASDFAGPKPGNPQNHADADAAPTVASTAPADNAAGVPVDTNLQIAFSEPVSVDAAWFTITCTTSGTHSATVTGGPTTWTLDPDTNFALDETCTVTVTGSAVHDTDTNDPPDTMATDFTFHVSTPAPPLRIHEIQGAAQLSPKVGTSVAGVEGIVTLKTSNGFFMQDPQPDADPATSEGIFVFGSRSAGLVSVGDLVKVNGQVQEFRGSGSAASINLPVTEIGNTSIGGVVSQGNPLPAPVVWSPPGQTIEDDATGNVESSGTFDPGNDGIDYAESLEGMLVEIDDATASGGSVDFPSSQTTEVSLVNAAAGLRTPRGGVVIQAGDFNPERLILQAALGTLPHVNVGDTFSGALVGALDYNFGNYKLRPTATPIVVSGGLQQEVTSPAGTDQLSVATFNVENLDPGDGPTKFDRLARILVDNLRSPDVVALEEVQDSNGAVDDGTTDSTVTLDTLVAAIKAAGGPAYQYRYIKPVNDQDGGEPGGNIRVAFLYRTDRGLAFVDRPGADSTTANEVVGTGADTQLLYSPGRIDPTSDAWTSSRKPLAAEFTYDGHRLFVIANHFNSKGGDDPLYGKFQPPVNSSEVQRHKQAQEVADFVGKITAADPKANVVVLGDLNDFQFSDTVGILEAAGLHDLVKTLPLNEQYTYDFDGNSQAIDHILLGGNLFEHASFAYDAVHVNAEFADRASDHDPQVVLLALPKPTVSASRAPAPNAAGWSSTDVTVTFTCVDPLSALVACPSPVTVTAEGANQSVTGESKTKAGDTVGATLTGISIDKTNPVVTYSGNAGTYDVDQTVHITCSATDALSGIASSTCTDVNGPAWSFGLGAHTVSAAATDKAGNTAPGSTTYTIKATSAGLCRLVAQFVDKPQLATSLCAMLERRSWTAFRNEVQAQTGKSLSADEAAVLRQLVDALARG